MDLLSTELADALSQFAGTFANYLVRPWTFYQLVIIALCYGVGLFLSRQIEPALEARARKIRGNADILRMVIALLRRTEWIVFLLLLWIVRTALIANTWPSRSYLLSLAIALGFAWLASAVLWDAFKEAGIAIPFPHREIIMRTPVEVRPEKPSRKSRQAKTN